MISNDKKHIIATIFHDPLEQDVPVSDPLQRGKYYGGVYLGRRYMYSETLIDSMTPQKLEAFIRKQIGMS